MFVLLIGSNKEKGFLRDLQQFKWYICFSSIKGQAMFAYFIVKYLHVQGDLITQHAKLNLLLKFFYCNIWHHIRTYIFGKTHC